MKNLCLKLKTLVLYRSHTEDAEIENYEQIDLTDGTNRVL